MDQRDRLVAICGDAIEELKKIPSNSVNLIITDPPYNLNKDYMYSNDFLQHKDYLKFSKKWLHEAYRVLTDNGSLYVFMGVRYISYIYSILEEDLGMFFNSWITWHYTQGIGKTRGYSPRHDDILFFTKSKNSFVFNIDDIRVPQKYYRKINNMRGANPGNVWQFSHVHYCHKNRQYHPTQKPEALYERMILASSNKGDVVLDPFVGSGTLLRVCQQLDRCAIGIDNNPDYIQMTKARLALPFQGFDSVDERMMRVPEDLKNDIVRNEYIYNHIKWFLNNHTDKIELFIKDVNRKYQQG